MAPTPRFPILDPLVATLDAVAASARAICTLPATAWPDLGPVPGPDPPGGALRCCAFCGTPLTAGYRRGPDGQEIHCNRRACLEMIRNLALFALDTSIGSEPPGDRDPIPF